MATAMRAGLRGKVGVVLEDSADLIARDFYAVAFGKVLTDLERLAGETRP